MGAAELPGSPDPLYYLANFQIMLDTIVRRDGDLLSADERRFVVDFRALPANARALLVRMAMRKGSLFRASRLRYAEIEDLAGALSRLAGTGWIDDQPLLSVENLFSLFTKSEVARILGLPRTALKERKGAVLSGVRDAFARCRRLPDWGPAPDAVYRLEVAPLALRLRLMFFGNFHQDLKEFVLSDLGIFKYQPIRLHPGSRPFRSRRDVDGFHALYRCRELLREGVDPSIAEAALPPRIVDCEWLEERRESLRFRIARAHERAGNAGRAYEIYSTCAHPEAAIRAQRSAAAPGRAGLRRKPGTAAFPGFELRIRRTAADRPVEHLVAELLVGASVECTEAHFVENALVNSLFGLLCWSAVFAPLPGAFFHPFHRDPADLASAGFVDRRRGEFAACLAGLRTGAYKDSILRRYAQSHGTSSSFVAWAIVDEPLLRTALECFPAAHLNLWFRWMMQDLKAHRSGFPDLVQFFPKSGRYRLIEVKAPGDRLQDSQRSCLQFMLSHQMPVSVCRVRWDDGADLNRDPQTCYI